MEEKFKHIGLFEGIGGFSLAARWVGWETVAWCEWNEFGQKVLKYHFPEAEGYGDITKTDFTKYANRIDIVTGGFPCQPYSTAGKRKGKEDERHLWPEMLRAIREIQPRYVVGENVRGLTNWNGGMVFDEVQADLEAQGFEVLPFLLPACAVDAPHRRDRIWFVAKNTNQNGRGGEQREEKSNLGELRNVGSGDNGRLPADNAKIGATSNSDSDGQPGSHGEYEVYPSQRRLDALGDIEQGGKYGHSPDTSIERLQRSKVEGGSERVREKRKEQFTGRICTNWQNFPTQSPVCGGNDGLSRELDGITFPKWRSESIKAYGNAIVPQVAYEIFKAINACGGVFV